jgi:hypothetical protein
MAEVEAVRGVCQTNRLYPAPRNRRIRNALRDGAPLTVHWVRTHEAASTVEEAVAKTYAWSDRKRMFTPAHIRSAWDALQERGWLGGA